METYTDADTGTDADTDADTDSYRHGYRYRRRHNIDKYQQPLQIDYFLAFVQIAVGSQISNVLDEVMQPKIRHGPVTDKVSLEAAVNQSESPDAHPIPIPTPIPHIKHAAVRATG